MTGIWRNWGALVKAVLSVFFAPPEDAARSVVHAATMDLSGAPKHAFVARGAFASALLCGTPSSEVPYWRKCLFGALAATFDWPVRRLSGRALWSRPRLVAPASAARDARLAAAVWDRAARAARLP